MTQTVNDAITPVVAPVKERKIAILGFADSRVDAPFQDDSWEIWGVNDVYAYVPRVTATFELHHLKGLAENGRRNPQYHQWLAKGKMPVYMIDPRPEFPAAQRFPFEPLREMFPRAYFTNSISWMVGLAIAELTDMCGLPDGRAVRLAKPGVQLGLWGVDMAATSEYAAQRPSVEYFIGIADGCGIPTFIPDTSDICKASALYGIDTTAPLRQKLEGKLAGITQTQQQNASQLIQLQLQREALLEQKGHLAGAKEAYKYIKGVWTLETDIPVGATIEGKDRGAALPGAPLAVTNG